MRILTVGEIRSLDRASERLGVGTPELMARAGKAVAQEAMKLLASSAGKKVAVVCGKGHNGGDGLAAAVELRRMGNQVSIFLSCGESEISGVPRTFLDECLGAGISLQPSVDAAGDPLRSFNLVVDALLGIGGHGELSEKMLPWTQAINGCGKPVIAVDIPTGVRGDDGQAASGAVRAAVTVTLGFLKPGLLFQPGASLAGRIVVADIGYPKDATESVISDCRMIDAQFVAGHLRPPAPDAHKWRQGMVLVIAGSKDFTGAACLTAEAALKSGAGMVFLAAPASLRPILQAKLTEVIVVEVAEGEEGYFHADAMVKGEDRADAVVIGPGISSHPDALTFARRVLDRCKVPTVVDADALQSVTPAGRGAGERMITPHYGEAARMLGTSPEEIRKTPLASALRLAEEFGSVAILKNAPTVVAVEGALRVNSTGHQGLATAGSGDVLSGMIGAFLAQGMNPFTAAQAATYVHGKAADELLPETGYRGLTAGALLRQIPLTLATIEMGGAMGIPLEGLR